MAAITASLVKELREMTGAGMMDCKKALVEADGDLNKAVEILREKGLKKCAICSTENQLANAFCFKCGARFADDDAIPADVIAPPNACATPPSELKPEAPAPAVEAVEAVPAAAAPEEAGE